MIYEIATDGRVVWVNTETLLGRFSKTGIDVHVEGKCLKSTCISKNSTTQEDWEVFKKLMKKIHGITIRDRFKPNHLRADGDKVKERFSCLYATKR